MRMRRSRPMDLRRRQPVSNSTPLSSTLIFEYSILGLTASAELLGNVHGVVVHITAERILSEFIPAFL